MTEIRLNTVSEIFSGYAFSTEDMKDYGIPILKIGNINPDGTLLLTSDSKYPNEVTKKIEKYYLQPTDYLICMTGATIGKIGRSTSIKANNFLVNQRVGIIRPYNTVNYDYLYYILSLKDFRKYIEIVGSGAAQANISAKDIGKFRLSCTTDTKEQTKIAEILKKYDVLMETNTKRIEILERFSENLYNEWFIRFRFPGHNNSQFEFQNPKGWMLSTCEAKMRRPFGWRYDELINIAEFKRGKNITAAEMIEGDIPVISAGLNPSGYHNEANVFGKNITVSSSGANAGYLSYHLSDIWAADCSYYQCDTNLWFVYNALKFLQPVISNMQVGSAQPHVYAKTINRLSTIIPPNELIELYCEKVNPIYEQIRLLTLANENLVKQRDALLPRLMSGKLNLEGKEIV
jgi:type I restriction enzyme S subunit